jgi:putative spermidine/putrescine transport system permease protein
VRREVVKPIFSIWTILILIGLYGPFFVMAILSFTGPQGNMTFPLRNVGVYWWKYLFGLTEHLVADPVSEQYGGSLFRSLIIALIVTVVSTILALTAAQAFRNRFRASGLVFYLFLLGIIAPGVTIGLGQAFLYEWVIGVDKYWLTTTLVSHITWTYPFSFLVLMVYFNRFDRSLEQAAAFLGASPWTVYKTVTLPLIVPGLLASALFAFTLSLDEFARTSFVNGVENTVPTMIIGAKTNLLRPTIYVVGTLTTVISLSVIVLILILIKIRMAKTKLEPGERLQEEEA